MKQGRFAMLAQADPARAKQLMQTAQSDADARWHLYEQTAGVHRTVTEHGECEEGSGNATSAAAAPTPNEVQS
jgi:hypothetical protein